MTTLADAFPPFGLRIEAGPLVPTYGNPFVVRDGNLVSARWPGDAERFANALLDLLQAQSTT